MQHDSGTSSGYSSRLKSFLSLTRFLQVANEVESILTKLLCSFASKPFLLGLPCIPNYRENRSGKRRSTTMRMEFGQIHVLNDKIIKECQHTDDFINSLLEEEIHKNGRKWTHQPNLT